MPDRLTQVVEVAQAAISEWGDLAMNGPDEFDRTVPGMARFVAKSLVAAGLVVETEQWSVVYDGADFDRAHLPGPSDVYGFDTRAEAEAQMPPTHRFTICRGVTAWVPADEGSDRG